MMKPIPLSFIRGRTSLSWSEAAWGYHNKHLSWPDAVELACDRLAEADEDPLVVELAGISKSNAHEIGELLDKLASRSVSTDEASTKAKWLYLILSWLFENKAASDDPLATVEMIYADFDYPEEVSSFVRYMPVTDGYDPSAHTSEENHARLLEKWASYLNTKAQIFAALSSTPHG
jgi:hypothetical protein